VAELYDKHNLWIGEKKIFTPGPFAPKVFEMFNRKWGLAICYEGLRPKLPWGSYEHF
jgi:predicted amidohydrolase